MTKQRKKYRPKPKEETPPTLPKDVFRIVAIAIIILVGLTVYFNTFANQFIWDDDLLIIRNEYIRSWSCLKDIFLTDIHRFGNIRSNFYLCIWCN